MIDARVADRIVAELEVEHDKPFFLAYGTYQPHLPWMVPRRYFDMHPRESVALPKVMEDDLDDVPPFGRRLAAEVLDTSNYRNHAAEGGDHANVLKYDQWGAAVQGYLASITFGVSLFAGKDLHVAVLSDEAQGAKGKVNKIRQSDILQSGHFFTVANLINAPEGDIEDIFDPEVYAEIVNSSYELPKGHRVTVDKLNEDTSTPRVVKKVAAMFKLMPQEIPMFDHYTPADWLIRNPGALNGESEQTERTLLAAERVFETFNGLLP